MSKSGENSKDHMRCLESLIEVFLYIDGQVEPGRSAEIQTHLDNCATCYGRVEFERLLKGYIKRKGCHETPAPGVVDRVLELLNSG